VNAYVSAIGGPLATDGPPDHRWSTQSSYSWKSLMGAMDVSRFVHIHEG